MSLQEAYGAMGATPTHGEIVRHVADEIILNTDPRSPNVLRRRRMEQRIRIYEDDYEKDVEALIDLVFETEQAQKQRKKLKELAKPMNVTRRLVDEVSSIYDRPASRALKGKGQPLFNRVQELVDYHECQKEAHRLTFLCNEVLKWCEFSQASGELCLRIITPDCFDVIPDPRDPLRVGGVLLDWAPRTLLRGPDRAGLPHYQLWDDTWFYSIDADGRMVGPPRPHGFGRIPGYLQHRRKPRTGLLDDRSGGDFISAHLLVVLLNLLTVRLAKSQGENQPVLSGNLARVATKQSADGETPLMLPPGVTLEMLQSKTDPTHYLTAIRHFVAGVAATYGMSYEQFTFQESADTSSGKAYQVRREKLTELRDEQLLRAKRDELETSRLMSDVLRRMGFPAWESEGLKVDFADPRIPQDAMEELLILEKGVKLGVDSVVSFVMRKNPDLDENEARRHVLENVNDRAQLAEIMRRLNVPGDAEDAPGRTPEENGAMGGRPKQLEEDNAE